LPEKIEVLPPNGPPVAFVEPKVQEALKLANLGGTALSTEDLKKHRLVLEHTLRAATHAAQVPLRSARFELVRDTVWWRRVNYFVSLILVLIAAAYPLLAAHLRMPGVTDSVDVVAGGTIRSVAETFGGFLTAFVAPWNDAVCRHPVMAALVLIGFFLNLGVSANLQQRIWDRACAAWVDDPAEKRLLPTGQRGALFGMALVFAVAAWVLKSDPRIGPLWAMFFASVAAICGALWFFRRYIRGPVPIHPEKTRFLLSLARSSDFRPSG
jgi:hypothetical protein